MGNGITNCYPDEVGKFISITVLTVPEAVDRGVGVDVGLVGWPSALRADFSAGIVEPASSGMFAPVLHLSPAAGAPPSVHRLAAAVVSVGFVGERLDDADVVRRAPASRVPMSAPASRKAAEGAQARTASSSSSGISSRAATARRSAGVAMPRSTRSWLNIESTFIEACRPDRPAGECAGCKNWRPSGSPGRPRGSRRLRTALAVAAPHRLRRLWRAGTRGRRRPRSGTVRGHLRWSRAIDAQASLGLRPRPRLGIVPAARKA